MIVGYGPLLDAGAEHIEGFEGESLTMLDSQSEIVRLHHSTRRQTLRVIKPQAKANNLASGSESDGLSMEKDWWKSHFSRANIHCYTADL